MESKAPIYIETSNDSILYNRNTMCFEVRWKGAVGIFESYAEAVKAWKKAKAQRIYIVYERNEMSPHAFFSTRENAEAHVKALCSTGYTIEEQLLDVVE